MSIELSSGAGPLTSVAEVPLPLDSGLSIGDLSDDEILELLSESGSGAPLDLESLTAEYEWLDELAAWLEPALADYAPSFAVASEASGGDGADGRGAARDNTVRASSAMSAAGSTPSLSTAGERALVARELRAVQEARAAVAFAQGLRPPAAALRTRQG